MASVKVFGSPTSAEVARVLTCLFEKEVEFQLIRIENYKGKERKPDYLKLQMMYILVGFGSFGNTLSVILDKYIWTPNSAQTENWNPSGQSLSFEDGKINLVESRAICRHISEKYAGQGNKDLIGRGTLERASIEQWLQTESQSFDPPSSALIFNLALRPLMGRQPDREEVEESKNKLGRVLDIYEQRLEETAYLAGDAFTLADLSHLPNAHRVVTATDCGQLIKSRKRVNSWWEAISSRPSWRRVVEMQKEPPAEA